jgi:hypothetical protein
MEKSNILNLYRKIFPNSTIPKNDYLFSFILFLSNPLGDPWSAIIIVIQVNQYLNIMAVS